MILQENRKIDRNRLHPAQNNWHKSHSRFYSSLFTKSPGTPVFIGITGGEEWSFTLHLSSPLFTTLHHFLPSFTGNCVLTFSFLSQESKILPLPWQYFAPTRHKTKRRDRKNLLQDDYFFLVRESSHLVQERTGSPKTINSERKKNSKKVKGGEEW